MHNVHVAGMLHGRVVRPPTVGATLVSVDEQLGERIAGIRKGSHQERISWAWWPKSRGKPCRCANKLQATWTTGTGLPAQRELLRSFSEPETHARHVCRSIRRT